jgi:hypothetical protein
MRRPRCGWQLIFILEKDAKVSGLNWLRLGTSGGSCKHGNEPPVSIKSVKFLE